ncbi:MAG: Capsule polysaccharide export-like protein [Sphingomonas bacterium]|jgi:capsular polysaccharide transport system permease protein|nr:lipopolysaccharide biosynthesis protein [Sphingomonas bacterium]MDB5688136.1 Capsule polysaccharide export-like protein [Sphingomonas bacterium]
MNMHGIITPVADSRHQRPTPLQGVMAWLRRRRMFLLVVVLPTLLVAGYYFLIAADQYESEAHLMVRTAESTPTVGTGLGQVLSLAGGTTAAQTDAMSVADYLTSHDAVDTLNRRVGLVERFRRPEADVLSRVKADPTAETLLKHYRKQVSVRYNSETGITTVKVRTFRPHDSYDIIRTMLQMGEQRVNMLNTRGQADALALSRRLLRESEDQLAQIQGRLTGFRQTRGDIDPQGSGEAQIGLVTALETQLAAARAQLSAMSGLVSTSSPQYIALSRRVNALQGQVSAQSGRLAGGGNRQNIASSLGAYEELRLRQQFAAKRYETAAAAFEKARDQVQKQQLYLVRVVAPNIPEKSLFPERWRILATVFFGLLLTYAVGWLIVAGVREHAA